MKGRGKVGENPFKEVDLDEAEKLLDRSIRLAKKCDPEEFAILMEKKWRLLELKNSGGKHDK